MERDFMGLNSKEEAIEADGPNGPNGPAQLTIFYKGIVNVYADISPEKAKEIMSLAHNGAKAQAQAQTLMATPRIDAVHVGQPVNTALSSAVSLGASTATNAPKMASSLIRVMQSNVPQMRESSLTRFLEKRKERIMASAPYNSKPGSSCVPSKDD